MIEIVVHVMREDKILATVHVHEIYLYYLITI